MALLRKFLSSAVNNYFSYSTSAFNKLELIKKRSDKIPSKPIDNTIDEDELPPKTKIDKETIEHLERLSLVNFANEAGVKRLEDSIRFADQMFLVDTAGVEPMISVLETRNLYLRDDDVVMKNNRDDILANAVKTEEYYFVSPPGNIPIKPKADKYFMDQMLQTTEISS